jgi:hypothetical protein
MGVGEDFVQFGTNFIVLFSILHRDIVTNMRFSETFILTLPELGADRVWERCEEAQVA